MSLLEDVFLEDEAGEAQELERVIEGDEFDERPAPHSGEDSNDNSEKEDEAEEDKRRVDPTSAQTKRVSRNPRVILNPARLMGPRGMQVIPDHFKDFKFKGKGHEKEDLDLVLKKLEHWAYRLYPKFQFEDCLKKIETLGRKRPVMVHLHKIRSDQYISDDVVVQNDSSGDEAPQPAPEEDEFDKLLRQQIELARATPAPSSVKKSFGTPRVDAHSFSMPKATSSPSISEEQKERMLRNRRLAEERRLARLKNSEQNISVINEVPIEVENNDNDFNIERSDNITIVNDVPIDVENHDIGFNTEHSDVTVVNNVAIDVENLHEPRKKHNRSNVIDSSDDDCEELVVNESISVDVHDTRPNDENDTINLSKVDAKKQNRSNVIDSDDGENVTEDAEEMKKRKSNVIDTEENSNENMVPENIQETEPNNVNDDSPIDEAMAIDEESTDNTEVFKTNATDILQNETTDKISNTIQKDLEDDFDKLSNTHTNHENYFGLVDHSQTKEVEDIISNTDSQKCDENNIVTNESKDLNNPETSTNNKENIDNNVDLELMDMDFNEDF